MRFVELVSYFLSKLEFVVLIIFFKDLKNRMNFVELIKEDERNDLLYENVIIINFVLDK